MSNFFLEITIIVCLASFIAIIFKIFRQPPILAYILTGIIVGPLSFYKINDQEFFRTLADLGITFLLFMVGLELKLKELRAIGKVALITGIGQIVFTSILGFFICIVLGLSTVASLYVSLALTFSSTIIVVKLLSDKKDLESLYGKISVGFLLVQDLFAIIILMVLSGINESDASFYDLPLNLFIVAVKGVILFAATFYLGKYILPKITNKISSSPETLFLFSIAWAFGLSAFVASKFIGFSIEIGGFLAGLSLANSLENYQIVAKIRPLRDFFITIFFVVLGLTMVFDNISQVWVEAIILSLFILVGNPIIVMLIMGVMGYRKRTSFLAGLTVAQISEFSLIMVFVGVKLGHLSAEIVSLVTLVGIITFAVSTYMILHGNWLYSKLKRGLSIFELRKIREEKIPRSYLKKHTVLIGANRAGKKILEEIRKSEKPYIVVDFNPDLAKGLIGEEYNVVFGDIADPDIQGQANLEDAKVVISTIPDVEDNILLLQMLNKKNPDSTSIMLAEDKDDARELYKNGADYVIIPHLSTGVYISHIIGDDDLDFLKVLKDRDLSYF